MPVQIYPLHTPALYKLTVRFVENSPIVELPQPTYGALRSTREGEYTASVARPP